MPNTSDITQVILDNLRVHPEGVGLEALVSIAPALPRRTLQRRVAALVAAGHVDASGAGRGRRYCIAIAPHAPAEPESHLESLSPDGRDVQRLIRRPGSATRSARPAPAGGPAPARPAFPQWSRPASPWAPVAVTTPEVGAPRVHLGPGRRHHP